jgi:hypothetical protein
MFTLAKIMQTIERPATERTVFRAFVVIGAAICMKMTDFYKL